MTLNLLSKIMSKFLLSFWVLLFSLSVQAAPKAVDKLDLPRYMGVWHEVARLPMRFQNACADDVKAVYTLQKDQTIVITNSCRKKDGSMMSADAQAKRAESNSKLHISFLPKGMRWLPFGRAQYWILRVDSDYQTAMVGTPDLKYLWILSRGKHMDETVYQSYVQTAKSQGYAVGQLIRHF